MTSRPKVLVVDDELSIRITVESILSSGDYELYFAENGTQALSTAEYIQPDIILLDVMMPGISGFEVCKKIRMMPSLAEVPIVLVTALDDRDARMAGIKAGADDFVAKPFDNHELRLRVQNLTRLNRYMRQTLYNSIELKFYETYVSEQSAGSDQDSTQINALSLIRDYVEADEALLVLFDAENPELATKKVLGMGPAWKSESAFLVKRSKLCGSMTQALTMVDYIPPAVGEVDAILVDFFNPIRSLLLAPISANNIFFGLMVFNNPLFDMKTDDRRARFLQLMVKSVSNATFALEHTRQLTISKAALEASQWEILNSRNTLRTFFDNIPSCIYVIDRSYTITIINNRRSERVDKTPQELVGGKCYEKLYGNTVPCPLCRVAEAFAGVPSARSMREWLPRETFIQWEITVVPIWENSEAVNQAIIFEDDVTEKWLLEANLIESEKLASIGQLAANVAHEINNPLSAIIANVQLLLRDLSNADEDTVEALQLIEMAGVRASKIVGNLLKSARREKREEFEEVSINETIQDALSMSNFEIRNRNVTVNLNMDEEMPEIFAHQNQLKGVWINLIMNALGAIENSHGVISISTRYEDGQYRIAFVDNGKGIPLEDQNRIFEPFFTTKDASHGTGLGLSVSRQVIKEHHGTIDFESKPGRGTKFIVILPDGHKNGD